jgi:hypothetical protein
MTAITPDELSAALGWPGGISAPVLDKAELLRMVSNARMAQQPPCPYVRHGRDGTHWCALAEQSAQPATITSPRGSLGEPIV